MANNCTASGLRGVSVPAGNIPCNLVAGSPNLLTGEVEYAAYGYNVTEWVAIVFVCLFGISLVLHVAQSIRYRMWWCLYTLCLGGVLEWVGWLGRLLSAADVYWNVNEGGVWALGGKYFVIQLALLIIAPAFLSGALYVILGRMIVATGTQYSHVKPRSYTIIFVISDVACLCIQALGGAVASGSNVKTSTIGEHIMVAGIFIQLAFMTCYTLLLAEFTIRYLKRSPVPNSRQINLLGWAYFKFLTGVDRGTRNNSLAIDEISADSDPRMGYSSSDMAGEKEIDPRDQVGLMLIGCIVTTGLIFIRSVFRAAELLDGWTGPIETNQVLFTVLDGLMMLFAWLLLNAIHPGRTLKSSDLKY
ncbi:hypothetical protein P7C73_g5685, partial [Tremellales sp. Uapishka_1]